MNNPEHLNYSIDKNRLRIGAAVGVIVITAGFALGSVRGPQAVRDVTRQRYGLQRSQLVVFGGVQRVQHADVHHA